MTRRLQSIRPEFVEFVPDQLESGVLYVSVQYKSVQHLCCCGCGRKVVTPLSPTGWRMTFDGRSVTLHPSIGNWQKECGSHYLIVENRIRWARRWSETEIHQGLQNDIQTKQDYYGEAPPSSPQGAAPSAEGRGRRKPRSVKDAWRELKGKLF